MSLLPWTRVKLDPKRTQAARAHFDITGNYDHWHSQCRQVFRRKIAPFGGDLATNGVEVVRLLSGAEATDTKAMLLAKSEQFSASKLEFADVMWFNDSAFLLPIVRKMLRKEIDAKIVGIFGSEYYVHSLVANRTMPAKAAKRSFLWHCDRGPRSFVKINMFLDATADHGGTTEFLDLQSSRPFEEAGYTFGPNARRVSDLRPLAKKLGTPVNVVHPQLDAGEAFIFFPSQSLHRGFLPTRGIRHMMSLVLLPCPIPWEKAWEQTSKTHYHMKTMATFPDNSNDLYEHLGLALPKTA